MGRCDLAGGAVDVVVWDRSGLLSSDDETLAPAMAELAARTNPRKIRGSLEDGLRGADVFVGVSGPGVLKAEWIQTMAGSEVTRGPEPTSGPISAVRGNAGETTVVPNDPKETQHTFAITLPPSHGEARVRDDGRVRVCTDPGVAGTDTMAVTTAPSDRSRQAARSTST